MTAAVPPPHPGVPQPVVDAATDLRAKVRKLVRAEAEFALAADATRVAVRNGVHTGFTEDELWAIAQVNGLGKVAARMLAIQIKGETRAARRGGRKGNDDRRSNSDPQRGRRAG